MKNYWISFTRMLVLNSIVSMALGQSPEHSWSNLSQLRAGQKIEVVDFKLKNVTGRFVSFSEDTVSLVAGSVRLSISQPDVLSVKKQGASHRKRNALIGLGIGAGIAMAVGAVKLGANHETGEPPAFVTVAPIGVVLGAVVGVALPPGQATVYSAKARSKP